MATPGPTSVVLSEFDLDSDHRLRCTLVVTISLVSIGLALVVCYAYFLHSHYRNYLRSLYNNLVVGSIVVQIFQAICRVIAAATLLSGSMKPWLCNALGGIDVFVNIASLIMIIGFYYCLMALRYNPLRSLMMFFMSSERFDSTRRVVWYFVAFACGMVVMVLAYVWLSTISRPPGRVSYFGTDIGYCSIPFNQNLNQNNTLQRIYLLDISGPTSVLILLSIGSFIALRVRVSNMKGMSFQQSWPVYVRFFTIILYFVLLAVVQTTAYESKVESTQDIMLVASITYPLTLAILSLSFLVSEGLLVKSVSAILFGEDAADSPDNSPNPSVSVLNTGNTDYSMQNAGAGGEYAPRERTDSAVSVRRSVAGKKTLNGFTSCIQSILVLEVEGMQVIVTNQDLLLREQDSLLVGSRKYQSPSRVNSNLTPNVRQTSSMTNFNRIAAGPTPSSLPDNTAKAPEGPEDNA